MPAAKDLLGLNSRNQLFVALNPASSKSFASSKYATKLLLDSKNIPVAKIFGLLATNEDVNDFDWFSLKKNFVIKPTNGSAGKGIVAFKKQLPERELDIFENRIFTDSPLTLHELGEIYQLSRERVRQLEKNIIKKMRTFFEKEMPDFCQL